MAPRPALAFVITAMLTTGCIHRPSATTCRMTRHWTMDRNGTIVYLANLNGPGREHQEIALSVAPEQQPAYRQELDRIAATGRTLERDSAVTVSEDIACPGQ